MSYWTGAYEFGSRLVSLTHRQPRSYAGAGRRAQPGAAPHWIMTLLRKTAGRRLSPLNRCGCAEGDEGARKAIPRFSVTRDANGIWIVSGGSRQAPAHFHDLAGALCFARDDAGGGEADLEFWVEGFYIFVHQTEGWPRRICAPPPTARQYS